MPLPIGPQASREAPHRKMRGFLFLPLGNCAECADGENMLDRPTGMERAFALAEGGTCESLNAIRKQLKAEGYAESGQLSGGSIRSQLMRIIATRKAGPISPAC